MDALRGAAAILVLIRHYFNLSALGPVATYIDPGTMGVVAFFCISGYVIPWSVLRKPTTVGQFLLSRGFRLYPAYWVSLALAALVFPLATHQLLANISMAQRFIGVPDAIGVYWTLQVELIFYVLIAVLLFTGRLADPRTSLWCLLGACALSVALAVPRAVLLVKTPVAPAFSLVVMFGSFVLYHHRHGGYLSTRQLRILLLGALAILMCCCVLAYRTDWGAGETPRRFIVAYLVGVGLFIGFMRLNLDTPVLRWLGSISYPLYLVHVPMRQLIVELMPTLGGTATAALGIMATLAVAAAMHRAVELPLVNAGKAVIARYGSTRQAAKAGAIQ
ncbi:acyltransferase family protein [Dyella acidiphila]|uniref:Acyltransferase n=1 Tax=Dyella acidiphila TaxID=2775866 RepID=A0ABR9GEF4_9GAMM|nr:acyltransferase [Dyella acidiphila]MBE1162369.1 acyltransferase [Dyella acidiphila]